MYRNPGVCIRVCVVGVRVFVLVSRGHMLAGGSQLIAGVAERGRAGPTLPHQLAVSVRHQPLPREGVSASFPSPLWCFVVHCDISVLVCRLAVTTPAQPHTRGLAVYVNKYTHTKEGCVAG